MEIPRYEEELPEIDQEDRSVFLDEQLDQRISRGWCGTLKEGGMVL